MSQTDKFVCSLDGVEIVNRRENVCKAWEYWNLRHPENVKHLMFGKSCNSCKNKELVRG